MIAYKYTVQSEGNGFSKKERKEEEEEEEEEKNQVSNSVFYAQSTITVIVRTKEDEEKNVSQFGLAVRL